MKQLPSFTTTGIVSPPDVFEEDVRAWTPVEWPKPFVDDGEKAVYYMAIMKGGEKEIIYDAYYGGYEEIKKGGKISPDEILAKRKLKFPKIEGWVTP